MLSSSLSPWVPPKVNVPEVLITYRNTELKEKCLKIFIKKKGRCYLKHIRIFIMCVLDHHSLIP